VSKLMCANCQRRNEYESMGEDGLGELLACIQAMKYEMAELVGSIDIANFGS